MPKTIYRAAYRDITIDSQKIDDDYLRLKQQENLFSDREIEAEIEAEANGPIIDIEYDETPREITDGEAEKSEEAENKKPAEKENKPADTAKKKPKEQKANPGKGQQTIEPGPGF